MLARVASSRAGRAVATLAAAGVSAGVVAVTHNGSPTSYSTVPKDVAALTATQHRLLALANHYGPKSGIVYVWGGASPGGFDCSGFVTYLYHRAGIWTPRDTRSQWYGSSGTKVPRGQERVGDAVYFHGSTSGVNAGPPPGHVGIYIGNGEFIEYYWTGHPAHVGFLPYSGDYMGAKRWYTPLRVPTKILGVTVWVAQHYHVKVASSRGWRVTFRPTTGSSFKSATRRAIVSWAHRHHHATAGNRSYLVVSL
jgi:cell wall-associated NlpC family hydrolase